MLPKDHEKLTINSCNTKPYIKISMLKKQFFWILSIKAIEFLRVFKHANLLLRKNSNTLPMF